MNDVIVLGRNAALLKAMANSGRVRAVDERDYEKAIREPHLAPQAQLPITPKRKIRRETK